VQEAMHVRALCADGQWGGSGHFMLPIAPKRRSDCRSRRSRRCLLRHADDLLQPGRVLRVGVRNIEGAAADELVRLT
jgi:hypothetical protein